jgi:hypothetical protein
MKLKRFNIFNESSLSKGSELLKEDQAYHDVVQLIQLIDKLSNKEDFESSIEILVSPSWDNDMAVKIPFTANSYSRLKVFLEAEIKEDKELTESKINEGLPSNITSWLNSAATYEQKMAAKQIDRWVTKAGGRVNGGTSIGKRPQTLILDLTHQGSEIYINSDGVIEFNGVEINNVKEFTTAYAELKK